MEILTAAILVLMPVLFYEWFRRFITLMLLTDDCFPGKHDKLIWGLAFVFLFPIAPVTFFYWQKTYLEVQDAEAKASIPR